jgi:hypothetical protein
MDTGRRSNALGRSDVRIFLYEFATCGGLDSEDHDSALRAALMSEGCAMFRALAEDLTALGFVELVILSDPTVADLLPSRCTSLAVSRASFHCAARDSDWTIVIAPETGAHLERLSTQVLNSGGRLLGPDVQTIHLASDKHALAVFLGSDGLRVPPGLAISPGGTIPLDFGFPAVLKLRDGAGSEGIVVIETAAQASGFPKVTRPSRLEPLCPGLACSVAVLCGPRGYVSLEPCRQHVRRDRDFRYDGGSLPLEPAVARRARTLAERAVACLPAPLGYLGVDLVLGDDPSGAQDYVIEINPRITTSYVGLRAATQQNLAEAMIAIASGQRRDVLFQHEPVEFRPDGKITVGAGA